MEFDRILFAMSVMGPLMTTVSQDLALTSHPKDAREALGALGFF